MATNEACTTPFAGVARPRGVLGRFWRTALELIYPRHCLSCGAWIPCAHEGYVCVKCAAEVRLIGPQRCARCAMPLGRYASLQRECPYCRGVGLRFRGASAPCRYEGVVQELIHAFKYRNATFLAPAFAELMVRDLAAASIVEKVGVVMPVPLHWRKRIKRGYNQAEVLAERIAKHYQWPLMAGNLMRVKNTPTQTALTRAQREENLRNAFGVRRPEWLKGLSILLCDDVMTTGATTSECARVLLEAGAKAVYVSVVAR